MARDEVPTEVSKQRDYQLRHTMLGMCIHCRAWAVHRDRCLRHEVFDRLRRRGLARGKLSKVNASKREKLAANLSGRYMAIKKGFLQPATIEQSLVEAVEIRGRLSIFWGGIRGATKLAEIIRGIETIAMKHRAEESDAEPNKVVG